MSARRGIAALVALAALILALGLAPAEAAPKKLTIEAAREKAERFAANICKHDQSCVASGVLNCRRQRRNVVFCRIFDRRDTRVQGRFTCNRLVRLGRKPQTNRARVTGVGRWHC